MSPAPLPFPFYQSEPDTAILADWYVELAGAGVLASPTPAAPNSRARPSWRL